MRVKVRKSASFQEPRRFHSASDVSSSSADENSDTALRKFNRMLRDAVAGRLVYFRKQGRLDRGRSVSDTGLCTVVDDAMCPPVAIVHSQSTNCIIPSLSFTSAGGSGSSHGLEEASDGSDADRPRRHHLRVPSTVYPGPSTGNFSAGAGGGVGAPRSAPATPLQLEPQLRASKHDKHVVKPLSGSAPSVRGTVSDDAAECKQPSKSRQKKFQRHFPQVGPEERVLNYYSCALVGDILLQGHLYITKNYFAFYSNVFGYVTKLLIPTSSVLRITKEKVARIIPNAVGVCTRDERHVFGSLLSRDATYRLMTVVWKTSKAPELAVPKSQDLRTPEVSEYSPEDDSSSGGADHVDSTQPVRPEPEAIMAAASAAVVQPARSSSWSVSLVSLVSLVAVLLCSALYLTYRLYCHAYRDYEDISSLSGEALYSEVLRWRRRVHGRAATELHAFLSANLLLLTKVRQSLEALSGVILTDIAEGRGFDSPNDTLFS